MCNILIIWYKQNREENWDRLISYATLWASFKCYQNTSQPVNQAICILLFCQFYLVILFQFCCLNCLGKRWHSNCGLLAGWRDTTPCTVNWVQKKSIWGAWLASLATYRLSEFQFKIAAEHHERPATSSAGGAWSSTECWTSQSQPLLIATEDGVRTDQPMEIMRQKVYRRSYLWR